MSCMGLGKRWSSPWYTGWGGGHLDNLVPHTYGRGGYTLFSPARHDVWLVMHDVWLALQDVWLVSRVVLQTGEFTPLYIATEEGHVKCVRALLDGGAAINQAKVCCARSMARHGGGCVHRDLWKPSRTHVQLVGRYEDRVWHAWDRGGEAWHDVWFVCAVPCRRRTGPRRCLSPVRRGTWSA